MSSFGGGWYWLPFAETRQGYEQRNNWYAEHVEGQAVLHPFQVACRWFGQTVTARP